MATRITARITARTAAMPSTATLNPAVASSAAPSRKPSPFTAFFDPVSSATQRNNPSPSVGASSFTADFDDILDRSLATPDAPCTSITKATEVPMAQAGSSCVSASKRHHLQAQPRIKRPRQPEARGDPARRQVRDHARDLVEHEEIGQLHRREAQRVEMQQDQHPSAPSVSMNAQ
jgi:hypothetical protein